MTTSTTKPEESEVIQFTGKAANPQLRWWRLMIIPAQQDLYDKWRHQYPIELIVGRMNPHKFFLDTGIHSVSVVLTTGQRLMMFKTVDNKQKLIEWITK